MTDPISNERLAEMLAGLKGVTPGPWHMVTDYPSISIGAGDYRVVQTANQNNHRRFGTAERWIGIEHEANATHIARCDPDTIRSLIEEVQASRRQSPEGVGVKGLEWRAIEVARSDEDPNTEPTGDYEAETAFGPYYIAMYFGSDSYGWEVQFDAEAISDHDSPEAAKAAAQADYERRILSSLSVKDPEGVEPVAWFIPPDADGVYQQVSPQHYGDPDLVPLYASPPKTVMIADEMVGAIKRIRDTSMLWAIKGQIPEAGVFGTIAQDADWLCDQFSALSSEAHNG